MLALVALLFTFNGNAAWAQQPTSVGQPGTTVPGWTFNVAPYLWMPHLDVTSSFSLPPALGGTLSTESSIGFGDIVSHLNFGVMGAADARYNRFSVLTDFLYLNLGGTAVQLKSVNFTGLPSIPISAAAQTSEGMNLNAKIWTLAGGYSVAQGGWGNFDLIGGFRYLGLPARVNYSAALALTGPRGNGATFGGIGSVSGTANLWNGIGGFRGRILLGDTKLFVPYYFDAGAGSSNLTWQIASGLAYHLKWGDVSLTYRYLSFNQNSGVLRHLSGNGPMVMANFTF